MTSHRSSLLSAHCLSSIAHDLASESSPGLFSLHAGRHRASAVREFDVAAPEDLLGFTAHPSWAGVALVFHGRAIRDGAAADPVEEHRVGIALAIGRDGSLAVGLHSNHMAAIPPSASAASGLVSDIAHRILGLDTDPEVGGVETLIVGEWLQLVLDLAADPRTAGQVGAIDLIAALHPGWDALGGEPMPTPADIAHMTSLAARIWPWERLHDAARHGLIEFEDLSSDQAAWMDMAFFARWSLAVHRPATEVLDDLSLFLADPIMSYLRSAVGAASWLGFADDPSSMSTGDE